MNDGDPGHHDPNPFGTDNASQEAHSRRGAGDPIEAIDDAEHRQAVDRHIERERQIQKRKTSKSVIGAQQQPVIPSVTEPSGQRAAEQSEVSGCRQQPGPGDLAQPMIDTGGDQMGANQAVGRDSAYEIAAGKSQKSRDRAPAASARKATTTGLPSGDVSGLDMPRSP